MRSLPTEDMAMIKHCVDYLALRGKRDDLGMALSPENTELLEELESFFRERADNAVNVPEFARRDFRRREVRIEVQFARNDGTTTDAVMSNLSGGGVYIETLAPLPAGQRTVVRIFDALAGREWRFGAAVAWVHHGNGMGLRFVGIPLEVRLGHRSNPGRRPLRRAA